MQALRKRTIILAVSAASIAICIGQITPSTVPPVADWTQWLGASGSPRLRARLRDASQNPARHTASIEVEVQNIWLTSPSLLTTAGIQQGVLRYEVDQCPPVVTTDTRLKFEQLPAGTHTIQVSVLGMDNRMLTPSANLTFAIP